MFSLSRGDHGPMQSLQQPKQTVKTMSSTVEVQIKLIDMNKKWYSYSKLKVNTKLFNHEKKDCIAFASCINIHIIMLIQF